MVDYGIIESKKIVESKEGVYNSGIMSLSGKIQEGFAIFFIRPFEQYPLCIQKEGDGLKVNYSYRSVVWASNGRINLLQTLPKDPLEGASLFYCSESDLPSFQELFLHNVRKYGSDNSGLTEKVIDSYCAIPKPYELIFNETIKQHMEEIRNTRNNTKAFNAAFSKFSVSDWEDLVIDRSFNQYHIIEPTGMDDDRWEYLFHSFLQGDYKLSEEVRNLMAQALENVVNKFASLTQGRELKFIAQHFEDYFDISCEVVRHSSLLPDEKLNKMKRVIDNFEASIQRTELVHTPGIYSCLNNWEYSIFRKALMWREKQKSNHRIE